MPVTPDRHPYVPDADVLDRYAQLALRIGLDLQEDQPLLIQSSFAAAPLARRAAVHAYEMGAGEVSVIYGDPEITRAKLRHGRDASLDRFPSWQAHARNTLAEEGGAILAIRAEDPDEFAGEDPRRVGRVQKAARVHLRPYYQAVGRNAFNWTIVCWPVAGWARKVFPELDLDAAERELWDAVAAAVRLDADDPVARWREHVDRLEERSAFMNARRYASLHMRGPGTDLTIGLADGHNWQGARSIASTGAEFVANMPTEEIFTAPHRARVDGVVRATRPLSHGGQIIDGFSMRFEDGVAVHAEADSGEEALQQILDTDEGARRLGEIALVPASSPISRSGLLFFNTLFDENAASHIALGRAYAYTVQGGPEMDPDEAQGAGMNDSLVHVDYMIGSGEIDVDGVHEDGAREPVMRAGEFVI